MDEHIMHCDSASLGSVSTWRHNRPQACFCFCHIIRGQNSSRAVHPHAVHILTKSVTITFAMCSSSLDTCQKPLKQALQRCCLSSVQCSNAYQTRLQGAFRKASRPKLYHPPLRTSQGWYKCGVSMPTKHGFKEHFGGPPAQNYTTCH